MNMWWLPLIKKSVVFCFLFVVVVLFFVTGWAATIKLEADNSRGLVGGRETISDTGLLQQRLSDGRHS